MEKTKVAGNSGKPKKENKMGVMPIPKLLISDVTANDHFHDRAGALQCRGQHLRLSDQ